MGCHFLLQGVFQTQGSNPCAGSRRTKRSQKELPHVRGQGHRPRVPGCDGAAMAERSYPPSKVSGGREETPCVQSQGRQPGGATPRLRSGAVAKRSYPVSEVRGSQEETPRIRGHRRHRKELSCIRGQRQPGGDTPRPRSGGAGRSHLAPEAKCGDLEEPPQARGQGQHLGGDTSRLRPGPAARRSIPRSCAGTGGPRGVIPR